MSKQEQKEFEGMEHSALGRKAIEYVNKLDQIERLKLDAEITREELVKLFKKDGKKKVTVEGRLVTYAHVESDKVSIKQNLDKNK